MEVIGWDLGGAHLKAAAVGADGRILAVIQEPCPVWQGLASVHDAVRRVVVRLHPPPVCAHALTMTGELADSFLDRAAGVRALIGVMQDQFPGAEMFVFVGHSGFVSIKEVTCADLPSIASANWLASGRWLASRGAEGILVDVGSTTTDLVIVSEHGVQHRGYTDQERMRYDELVYTGVVRTPLMSLATHLPVGGEWVGVMAELFATTADVYRLTGELAESADQHPTPDRGPKTFAGSCRRLARMAGCDLEAYPDEQWRRVAYYFRERQLARLGAALARQLSVRPWPGRPQLIGAGSGRFLVRELARRAQMDYRDFSSFFPSAHCGEGLLPFAIDDCAPAAAVASLALWEVALR